MPIDWSLLTAPFPPEDIEWKPGATTRDKKKGLAMAYITARTIQERLDEVFTPGGWKNEFRAGPDGGVICRIYFRNDDGEWCFREGGADNTDVEAVKGGLSNAMKRAGSALGIGRYLYKLPQQWVPLDERGRFAQTPRIPREFLPSAGGPRPEASRPEPSRPEPSRPEPSRPEPSRPPASRAPQSGSGRSEAPRPDARARQNRPSGNESRPNGSRSGDGRPAPRAGQKQVVRRVGGREVPSGDGANRPIQRPF